MKVVYVEIPRERIKINNRLMNIEIRLKFCMLTENYLKEFCKTYFFVFVFFFKARKQSVSVKKNQDSVSLKKTVKKIPGEIHRFRFIIL